MAQQFQPDRILIVRLGSLGDIVHSIPAVAMVRAALPHARIGWLVERRWAPLLSTEHAMAHPRGPEKPLVDDLHLADTRSWRTAPFSDETWREVLELVRGLRHSAYQVSIDLQGAAKSALLASLASPVRRCGFAQPWERIAGLFYDHTVLATGAHIVQQNCSLAAAAAGIPNHPAGDYVLPLDSTAEAWAERTLAGRGPREFAILSPGAGWGAKRWPVEHFATLARLLARAGIASLVNHGPQERDVAESVENLSEGCARPVSCTVPELIALARRAVLCVGGDTGPTHLAVAVGVPTVALFGPTDPRRNGPYGGRAVVLRSPTSPTSYRHVSRADVGLRSITPQAVLAACGAVTGRSLV